MDLFSDAHVDEPALDMGLSAAILEAVARGRGPDTARIYRPGPTLAFGRLDRLLPGFPDACDVARIRGLTPLVRLGGGRAAAYDQGCVIIELIEPARRIAEGLQQRFLELSALIGELLERLAVDAELGELPGEYCPGRFSLHLADGPKVAGIAQRVVAGAALTTGVLVVEGGPALRDTIRDVYAALELEVDIATAGALTDRYPALSAAHVLEAAISLLGSRHALTSAEVSPELAHRAAALAASTIAVGPGGVRPRGA